MNLPKIVSPEIVSPELVLSEAEITPGLQCCLLCGRTLTDRALHDALEDRVLAAIRAEHPEWSSVDGACQPCVDHYRALLRERMTREERARSPQTEAYRPNWLARLFGTREHAYDLTGRPTL